MRLEAMEAESRELLKTNIRIADERLTVLRSRSMCSTSSVIEIFLAVAIARRAFQNSSSKEILVLRPPIMIDRLMTAVFMATIALDL
jgi:hypothetical protein